MFFYVCANWQWLVLFDNDVMNNDVALIIRERNQIRSSWRIDRLQHPLDYRQHIRNEDD